MALSYQQTRLIRGTIPALTDHGERITTIFYRNMLRDHPELNDYFNTVNQANGRQPRALTAVILSYANNINHITELIPKMERMCHKHCSLGIKPEHYAIVEKYLIAAFAEVLGPAMTPQVREAWTKAYWMLAKMLIGREAQLYRDFGKWQGYRKFRIEKKVEESDDIYSFYLVPVDGKRLPPFQPGQYVSVQVSIAEKGYLQCRQYSLSDAPRPDYYRVTVKRDEGLHMTRNGRYLGGGALNPGVVSNLLIDMKDEGDIVELTHPAGEFFLDMANTSNVPIVLISAGVGVTPMMSILNTVSERQPHRPVSWIHGSRRSVPFYDQVRRIARNRPNFRSNIFKTHLAESDVYGVTYDHDFRVDLAKVDRDDLYLCHGATEYYICGPEQFMLEMAEYLKSKKVDSSRMHFELFSTGDMEFKVDTLSIISSTSGGCPGGYSAAPSSAPSINSTTERRCPSSGATSGQCPFSAA
ncbi:Nitric oxide dioxygenase [Fusarium falciforme]|uniref:Nitric oxide dioxygenase n=1 Tax=Fusarium falciforme TaxID=195108 RepID=UPI0023016A6C|nr:Nitric oxide dioxygenase [Fusarium falciforme]WAO84345.1 Nitric oxide dioxygenase [Fusarium falciforme]